MSKKEPEKRIIGPWRSLHAAIWLIGIFILASRGWWWPGILVLVAISGLYEGFLERYAPQAIETVSPKPIPNGTSPVEVVKSLPEQPIAPPVHLHNLLPQICPSCGGPIRPYEVKWSAVQSASCPYCGTNLPLKQI